MAFANLIGPIFANHLSYLAATAAIIIIPCCCDYCYYFEKKKKLYHIFVNQCLTLIFFKFVKGLSLGHPNHPYTTRCNKHNSNK